MTSITPLMPMTRFGRSTVVDDDQVVSDKDEKRAAQKVLDDIRDLAAQARIASRNIANRGNPVVLREKIQLITDYPDRELMRHILLALVEEDPQTIGLITQLESRWQMPIMPVTTNGHGKPADVTQAQTVVKASPIPDTPSVRRKFGYRRIEPDTINFTTASKLAAEGNPAMAAGVMRAVLRLKPPTRVETLTSFATRADLKPTTHDIFEGIVPHLTGEELQNLEKNPGWIQYQVLFKLRAVNPTDKGTPAALTSYLGDLMSVDNKKAVTTALKVMVKYGPAGVVAQAVKDLQELFLDEFLKELQGQKNPLSAAPWITMTHLMSEDKQMERLAELFENKNVIIQTAACTALTNRAEMLWATSSDEVYRQKYQPLIAMVEKMQAENLDSEGRVISHPLEDQYNATLQELIAYYDPWERDETLESFFPGQITRRYLISSRASAETLKPDSAKADDAWLIHNLVVACRNLQHGREREAALFANSVTRLRQRDGALRFLREAVGNDRTALAVIRIIEEQIKGVRPLAEDRELKGPAGRGMKANLPKQQPLQQLIEAQSLPETEIVAEESLEPPAGIQPKKAAAMATQPPPPPAASAPVQKAPLLAPAPPEARSGPEPATLPAVVAADERPKASTPFEQCVEQAEQGNVKPLVAYLAEQGPGREGLQQEVQKVTSMPQVDAILDAVIQVVRTQPGHRTQWVEFCQTWQQAPSSGLTPRSRAVFSSRMRTLRSSR